MMITNHLMPEQHKPLAGPGSISVLSISNPAWRLLQSLPEEIRPLGVFKRSIDFLAGEEIIAMVMPELLNGPFHMVVDSIPPDTLAPVCPVWWDGRGLNIDRWLIRMPTPLVFWNPRPCWEDLTLKDESLKVLFAAARMEAENRKMGSPFTRLLMGVELPVLGGLGRATAALEPEAMRIAALPLAGLGPGLTPSGDDFLAGVMLGLHAQPLVEDFKASLCGSLFKAAEGRTTRLSLAFLQAARDGMADERWHRLLAALNSGEKQAILIAARTALNYGETSGLDMVCGFLWLCNTIHLCG
jgi:hypothetical protein